MAEPFRIDSIGLSVSLPVRSTLHSLPNGINTRATIRDAAKPGECRWLINVESLSVDDPNFTLAKAAERSLARLMGEAASAHPPAPKPGDSTPPPSPAASPTAKGQLLSQIRNLRIAGVSSPGERFYVALRVPENPKDRVVHGVTIFQAGPGQFVAFELICGQDLLVDGQRVYESMIATARIEDPAQLESARRQLVTTGSAFITRLTPADFEAAVNQPAQFYRLYKPAPGGAASDATERGYRSVRFFKGTRSQIDATGGDPRAGATNPSGYLADVSARLLERASGIGGEFQVVDIQGLYFVSLDRREEAWSIRTAVRMSASRPPVVYSELGTRTDRIMTVTVTRPGKTETTANRPTVPAEGYLSQVECFMLPRLLLGSGVEADLGFYSYQSLTESITLRRDSIAQEAAMPGVWKITSRPRENAVPTTYLFRPSGELIRADMPDEMVMEPVWPAELEKLWKSKGLPTGALQTVTPKKK